MPYKQVLKHIYRRKGAKIHMNIKAMSRISLLTQGAEKAVAVLTSGRFTGNG